jgi:hypothetical protein
MAQVSASWKSWSRAFGSIALFGVLAVGCTYSGYFGGESREVGAALTAPSPVLRVTHKSDRLAGVKALLLVPFVSYPNKEGEILKDPFVGTVFSRGPCPAQSGYALYRMLEDALLPTPELKILHTDEPEGVQGMLWDYAKKRGEFGEALSAYLIGRAKETGADAVLSGVVYRYKERVGEALGAEEPASIAFSVFVLSRDGGLLFGGAVDKTQKELLGNIADVGYYVKGGLSWWPVERLARFGIDEVAGTLRSAFSAPEE